MCDSRSLNPALPSPLPLALRPENGQQCQDQAGPFPWFRGVTTTILTSRHLRLHNLLTSPIVTGPKLTGIPQNMYARYVEEGLYAEAILVPIDCSGRMPGST